mmetsp:Transcript_84/g.327  ORF Transcript_84/g.327 Transcript_84/m.327 type:complete len:205 (+) Transcript_84:1692-2306(+)|eukprot:scaffold41704_cov31-Tisochrysis_lutea.AAC.3
MKGKGKGPCTAHGRGHPFVRQPGQSHQIVLPLKLGRCCALPLGYLPPPARLSGALRRLPQRRASARRVSMQQRCYGMEHWLHLYHAGQRRESAVPRQALPTKGCRVSPQSRDGRASLLRRHVMQGPGAKLAQDWVPHCTREPCARASPPHGGRANTCRRRPRGEAHAHARRGRCKSHAHGAAAPRAPHPRSNVRTPRSRSGHHG